MAERRLRRAHPCIGVSNGGALIKTACSQQQQLKDIACSVLSHVRAVLVEERDLLAIVLREFLDERLLALREDLLDLGVDFVPCGLRKR